MTENRRVVALVQARMGSTRLPCKCMLHLHDRPLIDWVAWRSSRATLVDSVVFALPDTRDNDPLVLHLEDQKRTVVLGSEHDVLGRYCKAALVSRATHVVRICADNPLIWGAEIDNLIRHYFETGCDYAYNHIPRGNNYPDGLGAEILSTELLVSLAKKAELPAHREHCLSYIWDNQDQFSISTFDPPNKQLWRPDVRLDIDTAEDFRRIAMMPVTVSATPEDIIALFPKNSPIPIMRVPASARQS